MIDNKYKITQDYIRYGDARSGLKNYGIRFIVSHDTGNAGSTAHGNRSYFNNSQPLASAHTFIDDKYILEIVPLWEKAWHVMYDKPTDNRMFGDDANDVAIGVELCWGGDIDFNKAYQRYVWYHAYLCDKYNLDPRKHIVSHKTLDPQRKTDPENALNRYGVTWNGFIDDVVNELHKESVSVSNVNEPSKWAEEIWKKQVKSGYFDGTRARDNISREETAIVIDRVVDNIQKYIVKPLEKRVDTLEKKLEAIENKI
jgi:N-acetylmuramoyl-L-alanine amidase